MFKIVWQPLSINIYVYVSPYRAKINNLWLFLQLKSNLAFTRQCQHILDL